MHFLSILADKSDNKSLWECRTLYLWRQWRPWYRQCKRSPLTFQSLLFAQQTEIRWTVETTKRRSKWTVQYKQGWNYGNCCQVKIRYFSGNFCWPFCCWEAPRCIDGAALLDGSAEQVSTYGWQLMRTDECGSSESPFIRHFHAKNYSITISDIYLASIIVKTNLVHFTCLLTLDGWIRSGQTNSMSSLSSPYRT